MTKGMPPSPTEIAFRLRRLKQLKRNLEKRLEAKGWTPSDLAREIWGEYRNPTTGKMSANHRDRISCIVRLKSWPTRLIRAQIASALGTTVEELEGAIVEQSAEPEELAIVVVGAKRRLRINKLVSEDTSNRVMALLFAAGA